MSKEAFYFAHDYDPTGDPKISAMLAEYGGMGYGIFWRITEMLHNEELHKLPLKKYIYLAIARQMQTDQSNVEAFITSCINDFELFVSDNLWFWSNRVNKNIGKRAEISAKRSEAGKMSANRKRETKYQNSTSVEHVLTSVEQNATKEIKGNKIKGNKIKNDFNNNVIPLSRKKIINDAIDEFCNREQNSEPAEQPIDDLKEKSCAKKEKAIPAVEQAIEKIEEFALWRHVIEHHGINEAERVDMFKYFYEYNTDSYRIRYPTWSEMIKHFYNWVPIHKSKKQRQDLNSLINHKARGASKDKRNELFSLAEQSTEFLRRTGSVAGGSAKNRTDKIDERNNSASDALTRLAGKFGGNNG